MMLTNGHWSEGGFTTAAYQGQSYGQQTSWFTIRLTPARIIDLATSGCLLPKPSGS